MLLVSGLGIENRKRCALQPYRSTDLEIIAFVDNCKIVDEN